VYVWYNGIITVKEIQQMDYDTWVKSKAHNQSDGLLCQSIILTGDFHVTTSAISVKHLQQTEISIFNLTPEQVRQIGNEFIAAALNAE